MKSARGHQEEEEEHEELGSTKRDYAPSSNSNRDGRSSDKANVIRSKHSVTEQRRRSKINERFQILRNLIPHNDQKRDTASFLLEVIEYVQYLQERVRKYEGSCPEWSSEPTKLMPWRNSHWHVRSIVDHPQAIKNGSGPDSTFSGRFDENNVTITSTMDPNPPNSIESDPNRDASYKAMDQQPELVNRGVPVPVPVPVHLESSLPIPVQDYGLFSHLLQRPISEARPSESPITGDSLNQHEELTIEGGTISISSVYSQGLLNTLTQALQSAGVDLLHAKISVQVDIGKRANRRLTSGMSTTKDHRNPSSGNPPLGHFEDASSGKDSNQAQKRLKI